MAAPAACGSCLTSLGLGTEDLLELDFAAFEPVEDEAEDEADFAEPETDFAAPEPDPDFAEPVLDAAPAPVEAAFAPGEAAPVDGAFEDDVDVEPEPPEVLAEPSSSPSNSETEESTPVAAALTFSTVSWTASATAGDFSRIDWLAFSTVSCTRGSVQRS